MKNCVQINNQTDFKFSSAKFEKILSETILASKAECLKEKEFELSVAFVSPSEIATINKAYRNKNKVTDVLSFAEYENMEELCQETEKNVMLGELIICPEFIKESAQKQGFTFENEFGYIVSHGILHLLGYDHGEKMFSLQEEIVKKFDK